MKSKLIGIDGLGGSGKTTFSLEYKQQLGASTIFHLDDFIHPRLIRYGQNVAEWEAYYYRQWRYDYLIENILQPLQNGLSIKRTIEFYNKNRDEYEEKQVSITAGEIVLFEGVFLQREELRKYFDEVIFIDTDKETRLQRVLKRDRYIGNDEEIIRKYENRYFPAENRYLQEYRPADLADQVISTIEKD